MLRKRGYWVSQYPSKLSPKKVMIQKYHVGVHSHLNRTPFLVPWLPFQGAVGRRHPRRENNNSKDSAVVAPSIPMDLRWWKYVLRCFTMFGLYIITTDFRSHPRIARVNSHVNVNRENDDKRDIVTRFWDHSRFPQSRDSHGRSSTRIFPCAYARFYVLVAIEHHCVALFVHVNCKYTRSKLSE